MKSYKKYIADSLKRTLLLTLLLTFVTNMVSGKVEDNRFKASVMVASFSERNTQSMYGHAFLRMQYPAEGLDYCFTLETLNDDERLWDIVVGNYATRMMAFNSKEYMAQFAEQGRTVAQLQLNLTEQEIQTLWRVLDEAIMDATHIIPPDFFTHGCSTELTRILLGCIDGEVEFDNEVLDSIGDTFSQIGDAYRPRSVWGGITPYFFATKGVHSQMPAYQLTFAPVALPYMFSHAYIVNGQGRRPFLSSSSVTMYAPDLTVSTRKVGQVFFFPRDTRTPVAAYLMALLVVQVVVCLAFSRLRRPVSMVLFAAYNIIFLLLLLISWQTSITEFSGWNWMYLFYNPVPVLLWMANRVSPFGQKASMAIGNVLAVWSAVCVVVLASMTDIFITEQVLVTALFAVQMILGRLFYKPIVTL